MAIRVLDPALANQIAAGEVVERPASVLKELLENSFDAGATVIRAELKSGGVDLIHVQDDGEGVAPDQLRLALSRHATSKLIQFSDLKALSTMGFRGEALPSVASVARLEMTSRCATDQVAHTVRVEGNADVSEPEPAAHPCGTSVRVRDLFFNTPARRKFLRSRRTEQNHCEDVFKRLALSRPDVAMSLRVDGRTLFSLPVGHSEVEQLGRLGRLFGREFTERALRIDAGAAGVLRLRGWVGAPGYSRGQADCQYLYVNGRSVRDNLLRHALRMAYRDAVPEGRHPAFALYLELDAAQVDVNVHPTKHEVRFREPRQVHDFVFRAVERALRPDALLWEAEQHESETPFGGPGLGRAGAEGQNNLPADELIAQADRPDEAFAAWPPATHTVSPKTDLPVALPGGRASVAEAHLAHAGWSFGALGHKAGRGLVLGGQVLLLPEAEGVLVIDAGRARRLVLMARLEEQLAAGAVRVRSLLLPLVVRLDSAAADRCESWTEALSHAGFDLRRIGPQEISVRTVPVLLADHGGQCVVELLLAALAGERSTLQDAARVLQALGTALENLPMGMDDNLQGDRLTAVVEDMYRCLGERLFEPPLGRRVSGSELLAALREPRGRSGI